MDNWLTITGTIVQGHGVASGTGNHSPYPRGTIAMQTPHFQAQGVDLSPYYPGTLNVSIAPLTVQRVLAMLKLPHVEWTRLHPPETFSFSHCWLTFHDQPFESMVYYPHPETKTAHFQSPSLLEILAPLIPDISVGDEVHLAVNAAEIILDPH